MPWQSQRASQRGQAYLDVRWPVPSLVVVVEDLIVVRVDENVLVVWLVHVIVESIELLESIVDDKY